jgi:hypothetical protein
MSKTVKFTISLPAGEFREIESARRKLRQTRSRFIRDSLAAAAVPAAGSPSPGRIGVEEGGRPYGRGDWTEVSVDEKERRQRAIAAAGKYRSGLSDVARSHDKYLAEAYGPREDCKR